MVFLFQTKKGKFGILLTAQFGMPMSIVFSSKNSYHEAKTFYGLFSSNTLNMM